MDKILKVVYLRDNHIYRSVMPATLCGIRLFRRITNLEGAKILSIQRQQLLEDMSEPVNKIQVITDLRNRCHKLFAKLAKQNQKTIKLLQTNSTQKYKTCGKKVRFTSKATANARAETAGHRVYHCPHCNQWHLTSRNVPDTKR